MRRMIAVASCLLLIVLAALCCPAVLAEGAGYAGEWVCVSIDPGTGEKQTAYEGTPVADILKLQLNQDGTLQATSLGVPIPGTWEEGPKGVSAVIDGQTVAFDLAEGLLVNNTNGVLSYLEKVAAKPAGGGLLSIFKGSRYAGKWVASAVDEGDGVLKTDIGGIPVSELLSISINRDGTLVMTSMGSDSLGTWEEMDGGIHVTVDAVPTDMLYYQERLVAQTDGITVQFIRLGQESGVQAMPTPLPAKSSVFAGTWKAVRYDTMGYTFDIDMLFPDGCTITLLEDGTGEAFITSTFTEKLTWSDQDGQLALSGSYVFSSPAWNGEKGELTVNYGSDAVSVTFQKSGKDVHAPTGTPVPEPTPMPTPLPTAEPTPLPTPSPAAAETTPPAVQGEDYQKCETAMFTMTLPGEGWTGNEGWRYDTESYCAARYELKDASGAVIASVSLTVSSEGVGTYRDKIKYLLEYAVKAGKESLDHVKIGGIDFSGTEYENWGWEYIEYTARVPESRITLVITVEQPGNIGDSLQPILDSISYRLPTLTPPNVDPPLPEDGAPYQPEPATVSAGDVNLTAAWLKPEKSIILDSIFNNQIAYGGGRLYVLAGKMLYAYAVDGQNLIADPVFDGGAMRLNDDFEYLSIAKDGLLYVSEGIFNILTVKDGDVISDSGVSGDLAMHPGGEWGISFFANADPQKISASGGVLTAEPWVLSNLSDAEKRQGRFSSISCVSISDERIYVAGTDAQNGDAQRVAVFDIDGNELFTFGANDWMADDAFGSVTGIAKTPGGILVLDGNFRAFKLFTDNGEFLGMVESDKLLGTDYPWLSSMVPAGDGVLVAAAQEREDESCSELLIFLVTGF